MGVKKNSLPIRIVVIGVRPSQKATGGKRVALTSFGKQRPLTSVKDAEKAIRYIHETMRGRRAKSFALNLLLSRAVLGQDRTIIKMVSDEREKIPIKRRRVPAGKSLEVPSSANPMLSRQTQKSLDFIDRNLASRDPKGSHEAIFEIVRNTKKMECRIVGNHFVQAAGTLVEMINNKRTGSKTKDYIDTMFKLYAAAESLYEQVGDYNLAKNIRNIIVRLAKQGF